MTTTPRRALPALVSAVFLAAMIPATPVLAHAEESPNPAAGAPAQPAERVDELAWGIRTSFTNYISGPSELSGGVRFEDGRFHFPLKEQSFDPETHRLDAQFEGTVTYLNYCASQKGNWFNQADGFERIKPCALDLVISNPRVVIGDNESFVEATISSKQYPLGNTYAPKEPVRIATLFPGGAGFNAADGVVSWDNVAATLTEEGVLAFSEFYNVGEGLDSLALSYRGEGARPTATGPSLRSAQTFDTGLDYTDRIHRTLGAGSCTLINAAEGRGFTLLDRQLEELAKLELPIERPVFTAVDPATSTLYYVEKRGEKATQIKSVAFGKDGFGAPTDVAEAPGYVTGFNRHPETGVIAAISENEAGEAHLTTIVDGAATTAPLPGGEALFGKPLGEFSDSPYRKQFDVKNDLAELSPVSGGRFLFNPGINVHTENEEEHYRQFLLAIDPAAKDTASRAALVEGSYREGDNRYLEQIATNGDLVVRYNNGYKDNSVVEISRLKGNALEEIRPRTRLGELHNVSSVSFDPNSRVVVYEGAGGSLNWLSEDFSSIEGTVPVPNGRETFQNDHGQFLAAESGDFYLPTLDESRGDHVEYYVLRRMALALPPGTEFTDPCAKEKKPTPPAPDETGPTAPPTSGPEETDPTTPPAPAPGGLDVPDAQPPHEPGATGPGTDGDDKPPAAGEDTPPAGTTPSADETHDPDPTQAGPGGAASPAPGTPGGEGAPAPANAPAPSAAAGAAEQRALGSSLAATGPSGILALTATGLVALAAGAAAVATGRLRRSNR